MAPDLVHDLHLLAFRYVAGDLPEADSEAFELRLADDQAAREAVAMAVELSDSISACRSSRRVPGARRTRAFLWAGGLAAAASVTFALTQFGPQPALHDVESRPIAGMQGVAVAWAAFGTPAESLVDAAESSESDRIGIEDDAAAADADPDATTVVPSWVVHAVSSSESTISTPEK